MSYRKKVFDIEAFQIPPFDKGLGTPDWVLEGIREGDIEPGHPLVNEPGATVCTEYGQELAALGDWILRYSNGDYGVVTNEEFQRDYEEQPHATT